MPRLASRSPSTRRYTASRRPNGPSTCERVGHTSPGRYATREPPPPPEFLCLAVGAFDVVAAHMNDRERETADVAPDAIFAGYLHTVTGTVNMWFCRFFGGLRGGLLQICRGFVVVHSEEPLRRSAHLHLSHSAALATRALVALGPLAVNVRVGLRARR
jgi:hypothetical protein